jgi:sensor histidine kinase YesM
MTKITTSTPFAQIYAWVSTRWVYHTIIWTFYALLLLLAGVRMQGWSSLLIQQTGIHLFFVIGVVYVNYNYLIPEYLLTKKYFLYLLLALGVAGIAMPLEVTVLYLNLQEAPAQQAELLTERTGHFVFLFIILLVSTIIKIIKQWVEQERIQQELERKNLQSELSFLKSQINPHFLFNTLNSIYALSLKKSDDAPDIVLKLSEMMRYMLYRSEDKKVSLADEIQYINNYLALEQIRYADKAQIDFVCTIVQPEQYEIAPLIFIPFLENAFKHGLSQSIVAGYVTSLLEIGEDGVLEFTIQNTKTTERDERYFKGGIGLTNVKRRLELIYPNQYVLDIEDTDSLYIVTLRLEL